LWGTVIIGYGWAGAIMAKALMTLEPGDLIFTGTPGGVGAVMKPPVFLKAGDRARVEIEGIGFIENTVALERAPETT